MPEKYIIVPLQANAESKIKYILQMTGRDPALLASFFIIIFHPTPSEDLLIQYIGCDQEDFWFKQRYQIEKSLYWKLI